MLTLSTLTCCYCTRWMTPCSVVFTLFDRQRRQGGDKRAHQHWLLFRTHIHVLQKWKEKVSKLSAASEGPALLITCMRKPKRALLAVHGLPGWCHWGPRHQTVPGTARGSAGRCGGTFSSGFSASPCRRAALPFGCWKKGRGENKNSQTSCSKSTEMMAEANCTRCIPEQAGVLTAPKVFTL